MIVTYARSTWNWMIWLAKALVASVYSAWLSPSVWPALALGGLLGFWGGWVDGSAPARDLKVALRSSDADLVGCRASLDRTQIELAGLRSRTAGAELEKAPHVDTVPVAATPKRQPAKRSFKPVTSPAAGSAKAWWEF